MNFATNSGEIRILLEVLAEESNIILEKAVKDLIFCVKQDILKTRFEVQENANVELIKLYFRIGKIINENEKFKRRKT